jgi:hypothetical protein
MRDSDHLHLPSIARSNDVTGDFSGLFDEVSLPSGGLELDAIVSFA